MAMIQFEVTLEDRPGELARLTSALAHINIRSLIAEKAHNGRNTVRFMTLDEDGTRHILNDKNFEFAENEIILVGLLDRPGELAKLANRLGTENINIDALHLIDRSMFALHINLEQIDRARALLKDVIINV